MSKPKDINTLVEDIYGVFDKEVVITEDQAEEFGRSVATMMTNRINEERAHSALRLSAIGETCNRRLWYRANAPELAEPLKPYTRLKFLFGDLTELLLLFLAKISGHSVEGEQDTLDIAGIKGHRDAVVDGRTVDVKSASTFGFKKFKNNGLREDDPFGYLRQIGGYQYAAKDDPLVTEKDVVSFLAMDKQHGHLVLDTYPVDNIDYNELVQEKIEVVSSNLVPKRGFSDEPEGKSGNRKLGTKCSYCEFKEACWPKLRTFAYSTGPVFLTHVEREPKVREILSE